MAQGKKKTSFFAPAICSAYICDSQFTSQNTWDNQPKWKKGIYSLHSSWCFRPCSLGSIVLGLWWGTASWHRTCGRAELLLTSQKPENRGAGGVFLMQHLNDKPLAIYFSHYTSPPGDSTTSHQYQRLGTKPAACEPLEDTSELHCYTWVVGVGENSKTSVPCCPARAWDSGHFDICSSPGWSSIGKRAVGNSR